LIEKGLKTASYFWTGSEVWPRAPDVYFKYNTSIDYRRRCDEITNLLKKFKVDFATLYFNEPDSTGHTYGPDSKEYKDQVFL